MATAELEAFINDTIRLASEHGYHPTAFIDMRRKYKTIPAIEKLVQTGEIQSGFKRLAELGLLEWTIEAAVIKFPVEFSRNARACAEFRLRMVGDGAEQDV